MFLVKQFKYNCAKIFIEVERMNIGELFKEYRQAKGVSQQEVATATGISQKAISFWERNERTPNIVDCIKLADYYGISLDELVGREFGHEEK